MSDSGLITASELRQPHRRITLRVVHILVLIGIAIAGIGPLLWLVAASIRFRLSRCQLCKCHLGTSSPCS